MTSFLIGYPHIPFQATSVSPSATPATGFGAENVITGARGDLFRLASSTSSQLTLTFSLASAAQAEYLYIARAKLLKAQNVTSVQLENGSTVYVNNSFGNEALKGPRQEDFIATFARSSASASWILRLGASAASYYEFSKAYFGLFFDFGREPVTKPKFKLERKSELSRDAAFSFGLTWQDIPDAKVADLSSSILAWSDVNPLVLYDSGNVVFPGYSLMHVKLTDHDISPAGVNSNDVTLTFEELI